ncbi:hypothetical protein C2E23DRAFT_28888 [Lenzites betulinus]|nr:hypothetical protein C2E23DRAFT_28888 [Lenzites betulinus]
MAVTARQAAGEGTTSGSRRGRANLACSGARYRARGRRFAVRPRQDPIPPPTGERRAPLPSNDPREQAASRLPWHLPSRAVIYLSPFSWRRPCLRIACLGQLRRSGERGKVTHSLWLVPRPGFYCHRARRWTFDAERAGYRVPTKARWKRGSVRGSVGVREMAAHRRCPLRIQPSTAQEPSASTTSHHGVRRSLPRTKRGSSAISIGHSAAKPSSLLPRSLELRWKEYSQQYGRGTITITPGVDRRPVDGEVIDDPAAENEPAEPAHLDFRAARIARGVLARMSRRCTEADSGADSTVTRLGVSEMGEDRNYTFLVRQHVEVPGLLSSELRQTGSMNGPGFRHRYCHAYAALREPSRATVVVKVRPRRKCDTVQYRIRGMARCPNFEDCQGNMLAA